MRDADDAAWTTADVRVGVLGPVEVRTPDSAGSPPPERLALATEIVAFLALHPSGVHPNVLAGAVWPKGVTDEVRDSNIERVRAWLGDGRRRQPRRCGRTPTAGSPSARVSSATGTPALLLPASRAAASPREEIELLRRGLQLIRGESFADVPDGRYAWVAHDDLPRTITRVVVDGAHRLAELRRDDPRGRRPPRRPVCE